MRREALYGGWTLRAAAGAQVPAEIAGRAVPATVPGCVHTDLLAAGLIADPYLDDNERRWPGSAAPTGSTRPPSRTGRATTSGSTWSAPAWTRSPRSPSTASRSAGPRTCTAATGSTSRSLLRDGDNDLAVRFDSAYRYAEAQRTGSATGPTPTRSRSTSSARWPATSAGTGGRPWSPPASGRTSACTPGPRARLADRPPAGHGRRRRRPGRAARRGRAGRATCR